MGSEHVEGVPVLEESIPTPVYEGTRLDVNTINSLTDVQLQLEETFEVRLPV